jgi:hypothetical protein
VSSISRWFKLLIILWKLTQHLNQTVQYTCHLIFLSVWLRDVLSTNTPCMSVWNIDNWNKN